MGHVSSEQHKEATVAMSVFSGTKLAIDEMMNAATLQQRLDDRTVRRAIFDLVKTMLRQGLAFRGHVSQNGNFLHPLNSFARNDKKYTVKTWLTRTMDWTSADSQKGMIEVVYREVKE